MFPSRDVVLFMFASGGVSRINMGDAEFVIVCESAAELRLRTGAISIDFEDSKAAQVCSDIFKARLRIAFSFARSFGTRRRLRRLLKTPPRRARCCEVFE
jgi:hypothetical protein